MPIATQDIKAEEFLRHNNVCVYHTYEDDDVDNGVNKYCFTLDPYGREGEDVTRFDVRSLDVSAAAKLKDHPPCIMPSTPMDDPVRLQWVRWDESVEPSIIKEIIIEAIEAGLIRSERNHDGEGVVLDEQSLDWPDLAVSHKKMAKVLKDCRAGEEGDGKCVPASSASDTDPARTAALMHEMLEAILQGLDRKASAPAFMADVDQLGKAFINKLQAKQGE